MDAIRSRSRFRPVLAAALIAGLAVPTAAADDLHLVRDLDPGPGPGRSSFPELVAATGDFAYLFAEDPEHGREPWITDGTAAGTRLLGDVCPGPCPSSPGSPVLFAGRLLFLARAGESPGLSIWTSDGTAEGTESLGVPPYQEGSYPYGQIPVVGELPDRGLLLFGAPLGDSFGLWITDGTAAGTRALGRDGPDGWPQFPGRGSTGGAELLFPATTPEHGFELWVTDGTDKGTRLAVERRPGEAGAFVTSLTRLPSGRTLFVDVDGFPELWVTDGTPQGTSHLLTSPYGHYGIPRIQDLMPARDGAFFTANPGEDYPQIWFSDGTAAGTYPVSDFGPGDLVPYLDTPGQAALLDEALLVPVGDLQGGRELWRADRAGVRRVADICPGECSSDPQSFIVYGGRLFFRADDGVSGVELWSTDGTAAGTRRVRDACPGACSSFPEPIGSAGGRLFFRTRTPEAGPGAVGAEEELWSTDGTAAGTRRVTDLTLHRPVVTFDDRFPHAAVGGRLLFGAFDASHGSEPWASDGTPAGTAPFADLSPGRVPGESSHPYFLTAIGGRVYFFARDGSGAFQPWITDGTPAGTRRLARLPTVPFPGRPYGQFIRPAAAGERVVFVFANYDVQRLEAWSVSPSAPAELLLDLPWTPLLDHDVSVVSLGSQAAILLRGGTLQSPEPGELWITDGTAQGTRLLAEPIFDSLFFAAPGDLDGRAFFAAEEPGDGAGMELWVLDDGAGIERLGDLDPGPDGSRPRDFTRFGDRLFFTAVTAEHGREPWITDGSPAGTQLLIDLVPGPAGSAPEDPIAVGDTLFFHVVDRTGLPSSLPGLWATDGSADGTRRVAAAAPPPIGQPWPVAQAVDGRLWWIGVPPLGPAELWSSDGTAAGTSRAALVPGSLWELGRHGDRLLVTASSDDRFELWETDGSPDGTQRLGAVPLADGGWFTEMTELGSQVLLAGLDPQVGIELLSVGPRPPASCTDDDITLCLLGGRFAMRASWHDPRSSHRGEARAVPLPGTHSGSFWFFRPDNLELVVKALDGGPVNGWYWVFYGSVSDVEYRLEAIDTATGRVSEYLNPAGTVCGRSDTTAFPATTEVSPSRAAGLGRAGRAGTAAPAAATTAAATTAAACGGAPGDLCLLGGRFRAAVTWRDPRSGTSGTGTALTGPGGDRSGFFWFFDPDNVELVVKVLDGRTVNGKFWVFYGGLSDVEYTLRVTDTESGAESTYTNPPGEICGRGDTAAF